MSQGKLVRDNIPRIIRSEGLEPVMYTASTDEYGTRLRDKLREEVEEFLASDNDPEELADILEVLYALAEQAGIDRRQLERLRAAKAEERGSFANRIIWTGNLPPAVAPASERLRLAPAVVDTPTRSGWVVSALPNPPNRPMLGVSMPDPTAEFFDTLRHRHERLIEEAAGTIRFDLADERETEHWFLEISHGDLSVSRDTREADLVVRADRGLFDKIVTGEANILAAWLRHQVIFEGSLQLSRSFELILPGPPGSRHPRRDRQNAAGQH